MHGGWAEEIGEPRNPVSVGANIIRILRAVGPATDEGMGDMRGKIGAAFLHLANPGQLSTTGDTNRPSCA
ncbi:hypothetical protein ACN9MZ_16665 [Pseudoduganella sp. S-14]|uniref:hypothetical protein n=1 Tax=Pseudoduganella sp. S-14 TaxID=3404065 RepID=UPI003CECEC9D